MRKFVETFISVVETCLVCILILYVIICAMCEVLDYPIVKKLFLSIGIEDGTRFMWILGGIILIVVFLMTYIKNKII